MKISYGWAIAGAAMVVTCVGLGAMFSLGVFLQPMSEAEGWSRTGLSTAALLNFLCMGLGSFFWGALSDRLGTRTVVLLGGAASQSRGRPRLGGARPRLDDDGAARSLDHHQLRLAHGHAGDRRSHVAVHHSRRVARARAARVGNRGPSPLGERGKRPRRAILSTTPKATDLLEAGVHPGNVGCVH
jgi:hypothetical protein